MKTSTKQFKDGAYPDMKYRTPTADTIIEWVQKGNRVALENAAAIIEDQTVQHQFSSKHRNLHDAKKPLVVQEFDWNRPVGERATSINIVDKLQSAAKAHLGEQATDKEIAAWVASAKAKLDAAKELQKLLKSDKK